MLWSSIKVLLFFGSICAVALGAMYLLESDGGILVTFSGLEFMLNPLQTTIAVVFLIVIAWLLMRLISFCIAVWKFMNGDETALTRLTARNRQRKGEDALSEGVIALFSGEGRLAMSKVSQANKWLDKPELTNLLMAQAAEIAGDTVTVRQSFKELLKNDTTRLLGIRGLMKQKISEGDTVTAIKLAKEAFQVNPKHEQTQDILLRLQIQSQDWGGARETLNAKLKYGFLPRAIHQRRDAILAISEVRDQIHDDQSTKAEQMILEANRKSPDLIPAAVMAARLHIKKGKLKLAARVLKKAWDAQPHPELASAFAEIAPDETPQARIKRFATLTQSHPEHLETRLVVAELYLSAEDFQQARRALDHLGSHVDARLLTIIAAIERGEGAPDNVVKGWLAKAVGAPGSPQWVCDECQNVHASWTPICKKCGSFDTLSWVAPPASEVSTSTGVEMLPLIVGNIEDTVVGKNEEIGGVRNEET
ncbi:MAG: heme biosynthesis protein HemY [Aestuariivita sp.]|nr:heme biosynthesis protein HemY [Aestuariivita sp.]